MAAAVLIGAPLPPVDYMPQCGGNTRFRQSAPLQAEPASGWTAAAKALGFTVLWTVSYYIALSYLPTFTQKFAGLRRAQALWSNTIGLAVLVLTVPLMGHLSDRIGRKPLLLACCVAFVVLPYPLFAAMVQLGGLATVLLVQIAFAPPLRCSPVRPRSPRCSLRACARPGCRPVTAWRWQSSVASLPTLRPG
jgi:predicted MFS family arabinose efflux permease